MCSRICNDMTIYTVERKVTIEAPIKAVFDFHLDFNNLGAISPSWMKAKLLHEEGFGPSKVLTLRVTQFGVFTSTWVVKIAEYEPPHRLTDLVISGPLPYFKHSRTFSTPSDTTVELHDKLEYALPFGIVGRIANAVSVRKMMEQMFEHRQTVTKQLLEERFQQPTTLSPMSSSRSIRLQNASRPNASCSANSILRTPKRITMSNKQD